MCALFFLETPVLGSYPIFSDPRAGKLMIELEEYKTGVLNEQSSEVHFDNVIPGTVLFYNSWLSHKISSNRSESDTKFIHFILNHKRKI